MDNGGLVDLHYVHSDRSVKEAVRLGKRCPESEWFCRESLAEIAVFLAFLKLAS